jgi:hypothetical protein
MIGHDCLEEVFEHCDLVTVVISGLFPVHWLWFQTFVWVGLIFVHESAASKMAVMGVFAW